MARYYAPERPAVFLAANLTSYQIAFTQAGSEWKNNGAVWIGLNLKDADGQEFQLYRAGQGAGGRWEIQLSRCMTQPGCRWRIYRPDEHGGRTRRLIQRQSHSQDAGRNRTNELSRAGERLGETNCLPGNTSRLRAAATLIILTVMISALTP